MRRMSRAGRDMCEGMRSPSASSLLWEDIESAFGKKIVTGAVINIEHIDPCQFLDHARRMVMHRLTDAIDRHKCVKVYATLEADFALQGDVDVKSFKTSTCELCKSSNLRKWYSKNVLQPILASMEEFQERDSGWALSKILRLLVCINKYEPMRAGCNISLPATLKFKNAVINVKCDNDTCFFWSVVASLYPASKNGNRQSSYPHYSDVLCTDGFELPMTLKQIHKFERRNKISINVFEWENDKSIPLHITSEKREKHANLLIVKASSHGSTRNHFVCIRNLSRLVSSQINKSKNKKHICDRCLHYFASEEKLKVHIVDCQRMNDCAVILPTEEDKRLRFNNFSYKERTPFVIYADFECMLENVASEEEEGQPRRVSYRQHHRVFSAGYYVHCSYDESLCSYRSYRHESDCVKWFVEELRKLGCWFEDMSERAFPMNPLTRDQRRAFDRSVTCYLCERPFLESDEKVRDHCHVTGAYKGAAHANCSSRRYRDSFTIPVIFHNLSGYDEHFVIEELATAFEGKVDLLPITKETYISFTKYMPQSWTQRQYKKENIKFRFLDSFKFLDSSLDKLSSYLHKDKLKILRKEFRSLSCDDFTLLTRKGVFPYDYVTSYEKLNDTILPTREQFYDRLTDSPISEIDYAHAVNVWTRFNVETLGQYSDLYLKVDVLLLADVFENFRDDCIANYKLDPSHYFTLPGFAWDAMLRYTNVELELLTDVDMLMFVERGIRGGLSQCSHRYARANNKYLPSTYDPSKPSTYLMYFDVNNLYGWAMSQPLPYGCFRWIEGEERLRMFDVNSIAVDGSLGYLLEVDLEYPCELHDLHADLPFCPLQDVPPLHGRREKKLLATLHPKIRYVVHYRNLQQCLRYGLKLTKIHRILEFKQSCWLRNYIDLNTMLRTQAANDFQKNLFKLMNNAVFGKTMENVRKYKDVKLVTRWDGRYGAEALIARPNFHSYTIFSEDLIAVELNKVNVKFYKPVYVGMCILDISKVHLYDFHYDYMMSRLPGKCKILYTDTDSLIYKLKCENAYDEIIKRDIYRFDTSDYANDNPYDMPRKNKKELGLMKDENNGTIMSEFVGLRAKMYAIRVNGGEQRQRQGVTKKIRGVRRNITASCITFDDYVRCLNDSVEKTVHQNRIISIGHDVYTISERKLALSPYDDKRYIVPHSTSTLPWGHYAVVP